MPTPTSSISGSLYALASARSQIADTMPFTLLAARDLDARRLFGQRDTRQQTTQGHEQTQFTLRSTHPRARSAYLRRRAKLKLMCSSIASAGSTMRISGGLMITTGREQHSRRAKSPPF